MEQRRESAEVVFYEETSVVRPPQIQETLQGVGVDVLKVIGVGVLLYCLTANRSQENKK